MTSEQRIPDDLPVALDDAAWLRQDWTRGGPESEVSLNRRPASIGEIFRLVAAFSDRAADDEYRFSLLAAQTIRRQQCRRPRLQRSGRRYLSSSARAFATVALRLSRSHETGIASQSANIDSKYLPAGLSSSLRVRAQGQPRRPGLKSRKGRLGQRSGAGFAFALLKSAHIGKTKTREISQITAASASYSRRYTKAAVTAKKTANIQLSVFNIAAVTYPCDELL